MITVTTFRVDALHFVDRGPISLSVEASECIGLSGPSGSGKTLFLRALADLDPHDGSCYLDNVESRAIPAPEWRRRVGFLPADSQWWHDTVGSHFDRVSPDDFSALGFETDVTRWPISRLSAGERQRLSLLRLLANQPEVLLLDEPSANLDPDNTARVEVLVRAYSEDKAAPVLWVSHDRAQIDRVAQRAFRFENGRLRQVGDSCK